MSDPAFSLIHVGPNGGFKQSGDFSTSAEQLSAIVDEISNADKKRLIIYFHGGLVNEKSGMESAKKVNLELKHEDHYIVSFIWETGLIETLKDNLDDIFTSRQGKRLLKWAIRAVTKKLAFGTLKGGSGQGVSLDDIEKELQSSKPFQEFDKKNQVKTRSAAVSIDSESDLEDFELEMREEIEDFYFQKKQSEDDWFTDSPRKVKSQFQERVSNTTQKGIGFLGVAKAVVKIAWQVLKRYQKDRDHGLHATVVEEICRLYYVSDAGQWVWGEMKEKGQQMWQTGNVGGEFLRLLREKAAHQTLDLIGHSAGSICISHLLASNQQASNKLNIEHLFLLAPAARCDLFAKEIVQPALDGEHRFDKFRMFTMNDNTERDDNLVKFIPQLYPSSLLYFISGVLEAESDSPICGLIRHQKHSKVYNDGLFVSIETFLKPEGRLVTSRSPENAKDGFKTQAISHGSFDDDDQTLHSIKYCLLKGML